MNTCWVVFLCFSVAGLQLVTGRKVSALDDICSRGAYSFCSNQNQVASRDVPQPSSNNGVPPRTPFSVTPPPLPTVGDYCRKYQDHFSYFCTGTKAKDPQAVNFCPTYVANCDISSIKSSGGAAIGPQATTPTPELPPEKIQQVCSDYQAMANQYCFRPEIPKQWGARKNCDIYLKYCVATATDQLQQQNKTLKDALKENIKPCAKYQNDYIGFCVQNPKPYNDQVAEFCRNYKGTCVPQKVLTMDSLTGVAADVPQPLSQTPQLTPAQQQQILQQQMQQAQLSQQMQTQSASVQQAQQFQQSQLMQQSQQPALQQSLAANPMGNSPMTPMVGPTPLGNPMAVTDPLGSLGNPGFLGGTPMNTNPMSSSLANANGMGNPGTQMIRGLQQTPQAFGAAPNTAPSGFASNPLAVGSSTMVGNMAGFSQGTAINPFGQVASGKSVLAGPVGIQSGSAVDFSGIPGLSQIGNMLGRRKRDLSLLMRILSS